MADPNERIPYQDASLPIPERVRDLMGRMTFEEKVAQMQCMLIPPNQEVPLQSLFPNGLGEIAFYHGSEKLAELSHRLREIQEFMLTQTRLGIPVLAHCEALSGGLFPEADVFPVAIGLGASWNPENLSNIGQIAAKQMRTAGFRHAFSPNVDICRDPRWGRISECYSEDAALLSALSCAFIQGLQGEDFSNGVMATAKHYVAYAACESALNMAPSNLSPREIYETYLKPFQAAISVAQVGSIMNSYSALNGEPISSSAFYLRDILRNELGFAGMVVSDYSSIEKLYNTYRVCDSIEQASVAALKAGIDLETPMPTCYQADTLAKAVKDGVLDQSVIDRAVETILTAKFALGLFENPFPIGEMEDHFHTRPIQDACRKAARESLVLLKNENTCLPLSKTLQKIAIIGPEADSIRALYGAYTYPAALEMALFNMTMMQPGIKDMSAVYGDDNPPPGITPIRGAKEVATLEAALRKMYPQAMTLREALVEKLPGAEILYAKGCDVSDTDDSGIEAAVQAAQNAQVVILAVGGKNGWGANCTIGEGIDSQQIGLPGIQERLAREVLRANSNTVVVHMDGRPLSSEFLADEAPAILEAWQPATFGAQAVMEALFGEYNPGGKLPFTAARYSGQLPVYYNMKNGAGYLGLKNSAIFKEGYIDGTSQPLYCFGHGLSYAAFQYQDLQLSGKQVDPNGEMRVSISITNTTNVAGDEVVQLYVSDSVASVIRPVKELVGFKRIHLKAGESKRVHFAWKLSQMAFKDLNMAWKVEKGQMKVEIGSSSEDIRLVDTFEITGDAILSDARHRGFWADVTVEENLPE